MNIHQKFYRGDPLTYFVRSKLNLTPSKATLLIVLVLNLPVIILATIFDLWTDSNGVTGLLHDYAWWGEQFLGVSATIFFFFWLPNGIYDVINGLVSNNVIQAPGQVDDEDDRFQDFIIRFAKNYSSWLLILLVFCSVTLLMVFAVIPEHKTFNAWLTENGVIFWYHELFWYIIFLIGGMTVVKVLMILYWFNRLFREFEADVKVLHPDKAGGLSPLGNFSVKIGYMIGIFGFTAVLVIWSHAAYMLGNDKLSFSAQPGLISLLIVYMILAPIVFFAPIGSAHSAMKKARHEFIFTISNQFENDFKKIEWLLSKDSDDLKKGLEKIEQIQKIHNMATRFPIWPFNTASIVRFFSSVFLPILIGLAPTIFDKIFP